MAKAVTRKKRSLKVSARSEQAKAKKTLMDEARSDLAERLVPFRLSNEDDVLDGVYRLIHAREHGAFPVDKLTVKALLDGLGLEVGESLPADYLAEFFVESGLYPEGTGCAWSWTFFLDDGQHELWARARHDDESESSTAIGHEWNACLIVFAWAQSLGLIEHDWKEVRPCDSLRNPVGRLIERFLEGRVVVRPNLAGDPILPTIRSRRWTGTSPCSTLRAPRGRTSSRGCLVRLATRTVLGSCG